MQPQKYERTTDFTERDGDDTDHASINAEFDAAAPAPGRPKTYKKSNKTSQIFD